MNINININSIKNHTNLILGVGLYTCISLLIIFYNHHFYDDEIFNLVQMQQSLGEILSAMQNGDVHPPLSYFFNKIIFDIFDSYKAILIPSMIINVAALAYFYNFVARQFTDKYTQLLLFIFTFSNGALLLWTNGVRWNAYWIPLFVVLYTYLMKHQKMTTRNIFVVATILATMTYINYLAFFLVITVAACVILLQRKSLNIKNILIFSTVYFSLSAYQIYVFLTVHIHNRPSLIGDIYNSTLNVIYGAFNGGSVFIFEPIFLLFAVFTMVIMIAGFKGIFAEKRLPQLFVYSVTLLIVFDFLMIVVGLGGGYRNNVAMTVPFFLILTYLFNYVKGQKIRLSYIIFAAIFASVSAFNLITHSNTAKNSFNMPVTEFGDFLGSAQGKLIITYDPVTYFEFWRKGYNVFNVYHGAKIVATKGTNVYLVKTYQGSLPDTKYQKNMALYETIIAKMDKQKTHNIGTIKYADLKNKLPGGRPKIDKVQMKVFYGKITSDLSINF